MGSVSARHSKMFAVRLRELWQWLRSLDDGRFDAKYSVQVEGARINLVEDSILKQRIRGKHLNLKQHKKDLLIQSLGIRDFDDRLALLGHIQSLVARVGDGANTIEPAAEGVVCDDPGAK